MDVVERMYEVASPETIVIVAGDADFVGVVDRAKKKGWAVEVWFWGNAATNMQGVATFVELNRAFEYHRKNGGVPLPPTL